MAILPAVMAITLTACGGGGGGGGVLSLTTSQQPSYALSAIGASPTGGVGGQQGQGITVAVIDGEFDTDHPDLRDAFRRDKVGEVVGLNVYEGHSDVRPVNQRINSPAAGIAENFSREEKQREEQEREADFSKSISHGTHVSGIIAARNNGIGTVGVAPRAEIVPIVLFRDYFVPDKYLGWAKSDPAAFLTSNRRLAEAVNFARAQDAFVINNSWGRNRAPYWVKLPNSENRFLLHNLFPDNEYSHASVFNDVARSAWEAAANDGRVIVFSAGNDGWNGETGLIDIYDKAIDYDSKAANKPIDEIPTKGLTYLSKDGGRVAIPENIPSLESSYFLTSRILEGRWLTVVNVDKQNTISRYSNGCGIAMHYCLAAPGTYVQSAFANGEKYDKEDSATRAAAKRPHGDVDVESGDGYGTYSGTSMAAPVVSGAAAVLKGAFPNLTARQVVDILLRTATDLGAPGTDPVYGRGLVNLARALQPIGPTRAAAADAFGIASTADTRVAFSAAFGDAAPSAAHHFGAFDSLGRVYRFRAPLQDRVMPGPRLAGMLAAAVPPDVMTLRRSDDVTTLLRRSHVADSEIGAGQTVSFLSARHRTDLSFISARRGNALSPAALLRRDGASPVWDGLAPQARDVIGGRSDWRVADGLRAGIFFTRAKMQAATRRDEAYTIRDYGLSGRIGDGGDSIEARFGRLSESGRFLGSKPEGGFALARPTESTYLRLAASRRLTARLSIGADIARLRSKVDFRHDAFVRDTVLRARSSSVHLALRDAAVAGDRLVLQHGRPLAVTGGVMRQSSITGYDAAGAYRVTKSDLDLAVRDRHRMTQLVYQRPLGGRLSGFAAAAHHRNWSHRRGLSNSLVMLGLSLRH